MRRHFLAGAAFAALALLPPSAHAADLLFKSRATLPGGRANIPVSLVNVGGTGYLFGFDFALIFDGSKIAPRDPNNAFIPYLEIGRPATDVVVTGNTFVGTGAPNPSLYVGYIRGSAPIQTAANPDGSPRDTAGLPLLATANSTPYAVVYDLHVPDHYNVANDGTGSTMVSRPGATAVTAGLMPGVPVMAEPVAVPDFFPASSLPADPNLRVPLHKIAIGIPGDLNGNGRIDIGDVVLLNNALHHGQPLNDYQRIVADVAPLNGYVPGRAPFGAGNNLNGGSYGDAKLTDDDLTLLIARLGHRPNAVNFPVAE